MRQLTAPEVAEQYESIDDGAGDAGAAWLVLVEKYNITSYAAHMASYKIISHFHPGQGLDIPGLYARKVA